MKPLIGIPVPTTNDQTYNSRSWPAYADAVSRSGGEPIRLEISEDSQQIKALAGTCHGFCLPGSPADVDPLRYGAEVDPASAAADAAREAGDFFLLEHAQDTGKPVLAVCFGVQALNVWRGGSLIQDLTPLPVNHSAGSKVAIAHTALIPEHSLLGSILLEAPAAQAEARSQDGFLRLPINTSHHQAVASPGEGLRVVARCPDDGVIEAVENDPEWNEHEPGKQHQFLLGVQWHPERSYDISAASRALFDRLVQEATLWASKETK